MNRTALLAAASVIALIGASASAITLKPVSYSSKFNPFEGAKILYSQNSNDAGDYINSQNFTSGSYQYYDQGADDFVVPKGQTWRITEVDVTGVWFNGSGPATSENVIFYKNKEGVPGDSVANGTFTNLNGTGGPNFALVLPGKGLKLRSGHYWVSVVANMDFDAGQGEWGWEVNSAQHRIVAVWQNPENGFGTGCTSWQPIENCLARGPDLMFAVRGNVR